MSGWIEMAQDCFTSAIDKTIAQQIFDVRLEGSRTRHTLAR